jgi:NAD(P)-dependent dehydrogenase (short-subunit alcohol dehydrogenase family)
MQLKNKIALVTGSTHNIGLSIARAFAREGAKVIVHSRHEEDARKIAGEISGDYFVADVADPAQVAALFDYIRKQISDSISWSIAWLTPHAVACWTSPLMNGTGS